MVAGFKPSSSGRRGGLVPGHVERDVVARFEKTLHGENTHAHAREGWWGVLKQVSRVELCRHMVTR